MSATSAGMARSASVLRTPLALLGLKAANVDDALAAEPVPAATPTVAIDDAVAIAAPARVADPPVALAPALPEALAPDLPEAVASDAAPDLVADALWSDPAPTTTPPDPRLEEATA